MIIYLYKLIKYAFFRIIAITFTSLKSLKYMKKIICLLLLNGICSYGQTVNYKINSSCISNQNINYIVGIMDVKLTYPTAFSKAQETPAEGTVVESNEVKEENSSRSSDQSFSFYPNPVTDRLYIVQPEHKSEAEIVVYNMLGQLVIQKNMTTDYIDLSTLQKGMYLISSKNNVFSPFKILKN